MNRQALFSQRASSLTHQGCVLRSWFFLFGEAESLSISFFFSFLSFPRERYRGEESRRRTVVEVVLLLEQRSPGFYLRPQSREFRESEMWREREYYIQ